MAVTRKVITKDSQGNVKEADFGALAENVEESTERRFVSDAEKEKWNKAGEDISGKVDSIGGDISETVINSADSIATQFPVPVAGEKPKTFLGKVKKFIEDFKNWNTGVVMLGQLTNQHINSTSRVPTSALVYSMQQALTQAQNDISTLNGSIFTTEQSQPIGDGYSVKPNSIAIWRARLKLNSNSFIQLISNTNTGDNLLINNLTPYIWISNETNMPIVVFYSRSTYEVQIPSGTFSLNVIKRN